MYCYVAGSVIAITVSRACTTNKGMAQNIVWVIFALELESLHLRVWPRILLVLVIVFPNLSVPLQLPYLFLL